MEMSFSLGGPQDSGTINARSRLTPLWRSIRGRAISRHLATTHYIPVVSRLEAQGKERTGDTIDLPETHVDSDTTSSER